MYSNTAVFASSRVRKRTWWTCSVLSEAKKLSMGALSRPLPLDGHDQGADAQLGPEVVGHGPADDLARGHVLDRGQIQEALVGRDVGDVGQPDLVRPVRGEVPRQQVRGDREIMAAVPGSGGTAAAPAGAEAHPAQRTPA